MSKSGVPRARPAAHSRGELVGPAEQVGDSTTLKSLGRVGLIAYGVVHVLIGWLALELAWGTGASRSGDLSGALRTVSDQPLGKVLLRLVVVGLVALGLWQASEAVWGFRNREGLKRGVSKCDRRGRTSQKGSAR